jgi:tetratricopeptide (TPR) repeat protein
LTIKFAGGYFRSLRFSADGDDLIGVFASQVRMFSGKMFDYPGARDLVTRLFEELTFAEKVLNRLRSMADLEPGLRRAAIALAGRMGDSQSKLAAASSQITQFSDRPPEHYQLALEMAERAAELDPRSCEYQVQLGAALYRIGRHGPALKTLEDAKRLTNCFRVDSHDLWLAMAHARLGQMPAARTALDVSRRRLDLPTLDLTGASGLLREAESLIPKER